MKYKKIGINIPLFGESETICKKINHLINRNYYSCVDFSEMGNSQPHVTITMGSLDFEKDIYNVIDYIKEQTSTLSRSVMIFGQPYRENITKRYVFSDVLFSKEMAQFRSKTAEYMNHLFIEPARVSETPHITLAAYDRIVDIEDFINSINILIPSCYIEAVDISIAGDKGVKTSIIERIWL